MSNWSAVQEPESGLEVEDWWQSSLSNMPKGRAKGGRWPFNVHGMEHLEGEISQGFLGRLRQQLHKFLPSSRRSLACDRRPCVCRVYLNYVK